MSEEEIRLDQTKRVFDALAELISKNETCTYRYLIYDLLGFDGYYSTLISGLTITNALVEKEDLQQKVEQLEKELQITVNKCKQLENIRKEVIEQLQTTYDKDYYYKYDNKYLKSEIKNDLLNILNKGSE